MSANEPMVVKFPDCLECKPPFKKIKEWIETRKMIRMVEKYNKEPLTNWISVETGEEIKDDS